MPTLTTDQVRHIAKLARLDLSEAEVERFTMELGSILQYVSMLQEVATENIEPTAQVTGSANVLREDTVAPSGISPQALLACSPLPLRDSQIQTPPAHA